jgi:hypothetical protein
MAWRATTFAMSFLLGSRVPVSGSVWLVRSHASIDPRSYLPSAISRSTDRI